MARSLPDRSRPRVIVGLGNPGDSYIDTRHNLGFSVVDNLVSLLKAPDPFTQPDLEAFSAGGKGRKLHLRKPMSFMNCSGPPVKGYLRKIGATIDDLLVVVDDLDLDPGMLRMRPGGSSGGHRGIEDLIQNLGSDRFARCRMGIGRPSQGQTVEDFVLEKPVEAEWALQQRSIHRAADSALCWAVEGVKNAGLRYNGPLPEENIPGI